MKKLGKVTIKERLRALEKEQRRLTIEGAYVAMGLYFKKKVKNDRR